MMNNLALHGQAFALIRGSKLIPLRDRAITQVFRDVNHMRAFRMADGTVRGETEIFHVVGSSFDGLQGISPIEYNGLTLQLARDVDEYGHKFFSQRRPMMVLKTQSDLDDETAAELANRYASSSMDKGIFIVDRSSEVSSITGAPNEAQFNEVRQSLTLAVARIFAIPPSKLGVLDYSTFNNITEENISFVRECLMNYSEPFEYAYEHWFGYKVRHDFTELLEQNFESKATIAGRLVERGVWTPNEARNFLNWPPHPEEHADKLVEVTTNSGSWNEGDGSGQTQVGGEQEAPA